MHNFLVDFHVVQDGREVQHGRETVPGGGVGAGESQFSYMFTVCSAFNLAAPPGTTLWPKKKLSKKRQRERRSGKKERGRGEHKVVQRRAGQAAPLAANVTSSWRRR